MTITAQYASCSIEHRDAHVHRLDDGHAVYLRSHEVLVSAAPFSGLLFCASCSKPCVAVQTCWDHRITDDASRGGPGTWTLGEDRFRSVRHADGTPCGTRERYISVPNPYYFGRRGDRQKYLGAFIGTEPRHEVYCKPVCPDCQAIDTLTTKLEAYGDRVSCSACGGEHWYGIGD